MTKQPASPHPFGELLTQYRARRPGLSQRNLAELAGYDQAILVRMAHGKRDLTGPSGRERVIRIIETLADQNCLSTVEEANGLLAAAGQPPLYDGQPMEARLLTRLMRASAGHRVRRTNLPAPLTNFIGRAQELADVRSLLGQARLVTLTGSGGAGKTRLAQRVAADVLLQYPDGVWYAELAALADASLIVETVARIFGLSTAGDTAFDDLANLLRERHMLLVLDNCEHLVAGAAAFAEKLLGECARLSILATSREALNVEGELTWRVPPMQMDEAARLFVERARLAQPQQPLREDDATIVHICARLDGMPLALELAAARLNMLSLSDIASRLDNRFALLTEGRRSALPRHQTLHALIDWSHELLSAPEKIVFRRLGVFMGGWTLQTATQVVCDEQVAERDVLPLLTQLVRKSLVGMDERAGETRYVFLETIRQYALERLTEAGEMDAMRLRHAKAFEALAWESERILQTAQQFEWYQRITAQFPNLRQAVTWCFESGFAPLACSIIAGLGQFLIMNMAFLAESSRWSRRALQHLSDDLAPKTRAYLYMLPGYIDVISTPDMIHNMRQALACYQEAGDALQVVYVKANLGRLLLKIGRDSEEGARLMDEALATADEAMDDWMIVPVTAMQGHDACEREDFITALALYKDCLARCQKTQNTDNTLLFELMIATTLMNLLRFDEALGYLHEARRLAARIDDALYTLQGQMHTALVYAFQGDLHRAIPLAEGLLADARERLPSNNCKMGMAVLARLYAMSGEHARARDVLHELIAVLRRSVADTRGWYGGALDIAACIASAGEDAVRAARLFGAADEEYAHAHLAMVLIEAISMEAFNGHRARYYAHGNAPYIAKAREALGDAAFDATYAAGRAMTTAQAIAFALGEDGQNPIAGQSGF